MPTSLPRRAYTRAGQPLPCSFRLDLQVYYLLVGSASSSPSLDRTQSGSRYANAFTVFTVSICKWIYIFHNYINDRDPVFFRSFFVHCIMTTKPDIVTIFVFRTVILPKPENLLDITYPCFSICYQRKLLPNYILIVK